MAKLKPQPKKKRTGTRNAPSGKAAASTVVRFERFRFAVTFFLSCTGIYALIFALPDRYTAVINEHTARTLGYILNLLGAPVSVVGDGVWGRGLAVRIITECTAVLMAGLFICFVVFYPAPIRKKAAGLLLGIPALYLGNLTRLVLVFVAGRYDRRLFEILHVYLGQVFTLSLVLLSCGLWLKWIDREKIGKSSLMKPWGFLARLAPISIGLFFLWLPLHHVYIGVTERVMAFGFSLIHYRLIFPYVDQIYYETFNVVAFSSLVLATRSIPAASKVKGLLAGLGLLFLVHIMFCTCTLLVAGLHLTSFITIGFTLVSIGQYLLPVMLYLAAARGKSPLDTPWTFYK